jgi:RpiR family carbohydrate utilization transcriptional regulator
VNTDVNVLAQLQNALPTLGRSDTKIAKVVLDDPDEATRTSIAHLARKADVSEPSVNRFCKRLGASGYPDFKIWLARSLASGVKYMSQVVDASDDTETYPLKLVDNTINALMLARESLPLEAIARAVTLLDQAKRIFFFGLGTSAAVAKDAEHKFFRIGTPVTTHTDPLMLKMLSAGAVPGDVFVFISHTGRTEAIVEAAGAASAAGATVISLTAKGSPLARTSDCLLAPNVPENTDDYLPMTSRIVHLVLIDVLVTGVTLEKGEDCIARMAVMKDSLRTTRLPDKPTRGR